MRRVTDAAGTLSFENLEPGRYRLSAGSWERDVTVGDELVTLQIDSSLGARAASERFGRWGIDREALAKLPHAGTASSVLETIEPYTITNRIDVAGVESDTEPRFGVRGSSWTQNRFALDGLDITDPGSGTPLIYSDIGFYEETFLATSALPPESAGPGAQFRLVTKTGSRTLSGSFQLRSTGTALQSTNLDDEDLALGIEPREMRRYLAGRLEIGGPSFYGAASGLDMVTRVPKFRPETSFGAVGAMGKLTTSPLAVLGMFQRLRRPTFGARPEYAEETTFDATETFQVVQASVRGLPLDVRFGVARGNLTSAFPAGRGATPVRDLATGAVAGAPPLVADRKRTRWSAAGSFQRALAGHLLRAGFELSRATEKASEHVPGHLERLTVDGQAHAVSIFSSDVQRDVALSRAALFVQDAFFFDFLGRPFRLSPGVRLDDSRGGGVGWTTPSAGIQGGVGLTPSSELHFSAGTYPHALTAGLHRADEALSWERRAWTDRNGDGDASPDELGPVLKRGGGERTTIASDLPRPVTYELTVGIEKRFRRGFIRLSGYQRWEKRLLQTVNVGIDPASYRTFAFHDVGIDGVLDSPDDVDIPVYDQVAQLGEDRFLLTHPNGLDSMAQGVDLLLGLDHGRLSWRLSGRAYRDVGSGNPGNEARWNDTGVIGELFDDPNTLTNAEGRLFFDRAFTGKLALTARLPLGAELGATVRYWDGQPFARHLFFPELGQGFVSVQAFPRGRLRYAFNMTVDVRVERDFGLGGARLGVAVDAFNVFNQSLHTQEVVRSGMRFRDPTFVQPARTIVLETRLRF